MQGVTAGTKPWLLSKRLWPEAVRKNLLYFFLSQFLPPPCGEVGTLVPGGGDANAHKFIA